MIKHTALAACLAVCATASAIGPGDFPNLGPIQHGASNSDFLAALPTLQATFATVAPPSPGPSYSNFYGLAPFPGMAMRLWFIEAESGASNSFGVRDYWFGNDTIAFPDSTTLTQGDYVELPTTFSIISPFLLSSGTQFYGDPNANPDQLPHIALAFSAFDAGNIWFAIAIDDALGGGDRDWNDLRLALQVYTPVAVPEPTTWAMLIGFAVIAAWLWRRRALALA